MHLTTSPFAARALRRPGWLPSLLAAAALAACGNSSASETPKAVPTPGTTPTPGTAPAPGKPGVVRAPSRGPEHPVYSLADNRLSAHLLRGGGLYLPAGSAGFAKYVRFGNQLAKDAKMAWTLRQVAGTTKVARLTGTSAEVNVPLTAADIATPTIRVRAINDQPAARAFSVRVNGNKDINAQLAPGESTVELAVPAGQLVEGENELLFFVGGGAGLDVASIQIGGAAAVPPEAATFWKPDAKALVLSHGGGLAWYVLVPEQARITGDISDPGCAAAVRAVGEDGTVADGKLVGLGSAVELGPLAGKAARLELVADGCPTVELANAALVVPGPAPAAPARGEPPRYVVLFIMDSLRADRVKPFFPDARPDAPTWEKLAETSAVFLQNYVQGNESRVSHASIWSALYPIKHRMIGEKDKLGEQWTTIDEVAKQAGKYIAGVSANGYIRPTRGFGPKWDKFSNHIAEELGLKAEDILEKGLGWVETKKEPWFLYLGTVDTHVTWRAKEPWISKYNPGYKGNYADSFGGANAAAAATGKLKLSDAEIKHVRAIYDSNVSYQDDILNQLIEKLRAQGIWEQTMLIITADHGDEQWEDGRVGHGASQREQLIHVPLLIHYPPLVGAGKFTQGTEVVDIVPTLADALGAAVDPEWQGESLIPLSHGVGARYARMSFNSMYEREHAGRIGRWKVRAAGGGTVRVFDLGADYAEKKDLAGKPEGAIGARLVLDPLWMLRQWNATWKKAQWGNAANVSSRFAADLGE
jgi:arylsulfatase A-like enzyme